MSYTFDQSGVKRIIGAVRAFEKSAGNPGVNVSIPVSEVVGATDSPDTIGSNAEGSESASTSTWDRLTDAVPVEVWIQTRTAYYHAGDEKLYGYFRKFTFDSRGILNAISAETRVEIDAPEDC